MKLTLLCLIFMQALSDDLYWLDYETNYEYDWQSLQSSEDYIIETSSDIIQFNLGKDIKNTCQGQFASAIMYSKFGDYCEILGRHQINYYTSFKTINSAGLTMFYEGGSICKNNIWTDFQRRLEIKLICSLTETEFYLANSLEDCTTILEKYSKTGCGQEFAYSLLSKILFFSYVFMQVVCDICDFAHLALLWNSGCWWF